MPTPQELNDKELVILALKNKNDFCYIIERYEKQLTSYIRRLTSVRDEDIEDILQEVFIKIYQNLNEVDESLKFSSWVYRITHNEVISHYRHHKNRPRVLASSDDETVEFLRSVINVEEDVNRNISAKQMQDLLAELDLKYREILILRYFEEKNYDELSDILKKPKGTVATLLNRAKKQLAEKYFKKYDK